MNFGSDNWSGVAPEVMEAIANANTGFAPAYGGDDVTAQATARFAEIFEKEDIAVYFVATGGAANGLALSVLSPPYGMIVAHEESHIQMDECAGPEFFTGGAKILPVAGPAGKLSVGGVEKVLAGFPDRPPHGAPAHVLSITQATECGTLYSVDEVTALCRFAKERRLKVHVDGARFSNAIAALDCSPADLTWRAGVDVLCFGGTKNGCLAAEAVVFFDPALARDFELRRKRAGHLWSKMRFIAAQFDAYLTDDLWLRLAKRSNEQASILSSKLDAIDGVSVSYPTEVNEVFVEFPETALEALRNTGAFFYPWITPGDPANGKMQRLITSFCTENSEIDDFVGHVLQATARL